MHILLREIDPATRERLRLAYGAAHLTIPEVAALGPVSRTALYQLVQKEGWPLRNPGRVGPGIKGGVARHARPVPRKRRSAAGAARSGRPASVRSAVAAAAGRVEGIASAGSGDPVMLPTGVARHPDDPPATLARRLEHVLGAAIAALEGEVATGLAADPEAHARSLALNARTLAVLRGLAPKPDGAFASPDVEKPPRSLTELRDELLRHLERIQDEEKARRRARRLEREARGG